jgi:hypothetical protein
MMSFTINVNIYLSRSQVDEILEKVKEEEPAASPKHPIILPQVNIFNEEQEVEIVRRLMEGFKQKKPEFLSLPEIIKYAFPSANGAEYYGHRFVVAIPSRREAAWKLHRFEDRITYVDTSEGMRRITLRLPNPEGVLVRERKFLSAEYIQSLPQKPLSEEERHAFDMCLGGSNPSATQQAWSQYVLSTRRYCDITLRDFTLPELWLPYAVDMSEATITRVTKKSIDSIFS